MRKQTTLDWCHAFSKKKKSSLPEHSHKVKALGVWLSTIKEESITLNYEEKKETISKTIENWQFRRLMLLGKIVAIKSLSSFAVSLYHVAAPYVEWTSERQTISCTNFCGMANGAKLIEQK